MAVQGLFSRFSDLRRRSSVDTSVSAEPQEEKNYGRPATAPAAAQAA
jgi:hypothetical protein